MGDLVIVAILVAFIGATWGFVQICEHLREGMT
jgi:hypothetical protein